MSLQGRTCFGVCAVHSIDTCMQDSRSLRQHRFNTLIYTVLSCHLFLRTYFSVRLCASLAVLPPASEDLLQHQALCKQDACSFLEAPPTVAVTLPPCVCTHAEHMTLPPDRTPDCIICCGLPPGSWSLYSMPRTVAQVMSLYSMPRIVAQVLVLVEHANLSRLQYL